MVSELGYRCQNRGAKSEDDTFYQAVVLRFPMVRYGGHSSLPRSKYSTRGGRPCSRKDRRRLDADHADTPRMSAAGTLSQIFSIAAIHARACIAALCIYHAPALQTNNGVSSRPHSGSSHVKLSLGCRLVNLQG